MNNQYQNQSPEDGSRTFSGIVIYNYTQTMDDIQQNDGTAPCCCFLLCKKVWILSWTVVYFPQIYNHIKFQDPKLNGAISLPTTEARRPSCWYYWR